VDKEWREEGEMVKLGMREEESGEKGIVSLKYLCSVGSHKKYFQLKRKRQNPVKRSVC
jgi:hypothetical protein